MKGLKQFGAMALAAALTITMVAPVTARAEVDDTHYGVQEQTFYDEDINGEWVTDEDGERHFVSKSETIKNKVTSETWSTDYKTSTGDYYKAIKSYFGNPKEIKVGIKNYYKFHLAGELGETLDGKIKFKSGKANVTIKQLGKTESEVVPEFDDEAQQHYFRKLDGSKEYLGKLTDPYAAKRTQYSYTYVAYGKKVGTAKITYKVNGKKKTLKIKVTDDERPFKSITYAGKSLQEDYNQGATNGNYYAKQSSNKKGNFYTTKKKGKFKITMNKDYKFIAMYVLKDTDYEAKPWSYSYSEGSSISRKTTDGIDINGDGDFADTIDGIEESQYKNVTYAKYTKKNAKISLNTSVDKVDYNRTEYYDGDKTKAYKYSSKYTGNIADTTILIVYQNKITKGYGLKPISINYTKTPKK